MTKIQPCPDSCFDTRVVMLVLQKRQVVAVGIGPMKPEIGWLTTIVVETGCVTVAPGP